MAASRAIWLDAPRGLRAPVPGDAVTLTPWGPIGDPDALAVAIAGHEIVLTTHVPVPAAVLRQCRWVRAVVGIGPAAADAVDWDEVRSACLLSGRVEVEGIACVETAVRAELVRIERRLRSLDALGESWEGT